MNGVTYDLRLAKAELGLLERGQEFVADRPPGNSFDRGGLALGLSLLVNRLHATRVTVAATKEAPHG